MIFGKKYTVKVKEHYESFWSNKATELRWTDGPIDELPKGFSVLEFEPSDNRDMWTYATCGMSDSNNDESLELHLFTREKDFRQVELLTLVAHFHQTTKLALNHTVNFGRPWIVDSLCSYGLISLPYLDGPELENLQLSKKITKCLWLVPVTENEVNFKKQNGIDSLEEKFEEQEFNYLDPFRSSVV